MQQNHNRAVSAGVLHLDRPCRKFDEHLHSCSFRRMDPQGKRRGRPGHQGGEEMRQLWIHARVVVGRPGGAVFVDPRAVRLSGHAIALWEIGVALVSSTGQSWSGDD